MRILFIGRLYTIMALRVNNKMRESPQNGLRSHFNTSMPASHGKKALVQSNKVLYKSFLRFLLRAV